MKKSKRGKFFPFSRPYVFVSMSVDLFHHGHLNILLKAKKYGNVIVGLMTDKAIKSYKKRKPLIEFNDRKKILRHLNCVDFIIPVTNLNFENSLKNTNLIMLLMELIGAVVIRLKPEKI